MLYYSIKVTDLIKGFEKGTNRMNEKEKINKEMTLTNLTCQYVNIFSPKDWGDGKTPSYSLKLTVDKTDEAKIAEIKLAESMALKLYKIKFGCLPPATKRTVMNDGDNSDKEELKGTWYINAKSFKAPRVVDGSRNPILDDSNVCSGDTYNVLVYMHPYKQGGGTGLSCILKAVQWVKKGEKRFEAPETNIEDAFEIIDQPATTNKPAKNFNPDDFDGDVPF